MALMHAFIFSAPSPVQAQAPNGQWGGAPLACLPEHAKKWGKRHVKTPCHCPPKEKFCPPPLDLTTDDLLMEFTLWLQLQNPNEERIFSTVIAARDTSAADEPIEKLLTMDVRYLLRPDLGGYGDIYGMLQEDLYAYVEEHIPDVNRRVGDYRLPDNWDGGNRDFDNSFTKATIKITRYFDPFAKLDNLDEWLSSGGGFMPPDMMSQCCDGAVCPAGLAMTTQTVTVEREICNTITIPGEIIEEEVCETTDKCESAALEDGTPIACKDCDDVDEDTGIGEYEVCAGAKTCNNVVCQVTFEEECEIVETQLPDEYETMCEMQQVDVEVLTCSNIDIEHRLGCLLEGTDITLEDGSVIDIETLSVGDQIMGDMGPVTVKAINRFTQEHDTVYGINGGKAFFTEEHPILTTKGWRSVRPAATSIKSDITVGALMVGDVILTRDGKHITVESIDKHPIKDGATVYNIKVTGDGTFSANGILVKGFDQVEIQY